VEYLIDKHDVSLERQNQSIKKCSDLYEHFSMTMIKFQDDYGRLAASLKDREGEWYTKIDRVAKGLVTL
jgi:hypothetical protein